MATQKRVRSCRMRKTKVNTVTTINHLLKLLYKKMEQSILIHKI